MVYFWTKNSGISACRKPICFEKQCGLLSGHQGYCRPHPDDDCTPHPDDEKIEKIPINVPINVENVKDGLDSFLATAGVLRMDFPWGSIYWVGTIIRIDIR